MYTVTWVELCLWY